MLLTEEVTIYISRRNISYYKKKGYKVDMFSYHNILVKDLPKYCKVEVDCRCDKCGKERKIKYFEYQRYNNNYMCRKCSEIKRQETSLKNWGVDNPSKSEIIKKKISDSMKNHFLIS